MSIESRSLQLLAVLAALMFTSTSTAEPTTWEEFDRSVCNITMLTFSGLAPEGDFVELLTPFQSEGVTFATDGHIYAVNDAWTYVGLGIEKLAFDGGWDGHIVFPEGTTAVAMDMVHTPAYPFSPMQRLTVSFSDDTSIDLDSTIEAIDDDPLHFVGIVSTEPSVWIREIRMWKNGTPSSDYLLHTIDTLAYGQFIFPDPIPGDLNLDGTVDSADLDIVRSHWNQTVATGDLASGDATGDGYVGSGDLDLVRANWGAVAAAVPEPGIVLFGLSGTLIAFMRRKRIR